MEHLTNNAKESLNLPDEERILKIKSERWIGYTRGQLILDKMEDLLKHPPSHRMPNMLLVGETNNGKTVLVNRFCKRHQPYLLEERNGIIYPVLYIQAPPIPDEKRFYNIILDKIAAPFRLNDRVEKKQFQVIEMFSTMNIKMLIIDEIHHILAGSQSKQRAFLNVIKFMANELQIVITAVGTKEAFNALSTDPQLSNRFDPFIIPKWDMNDEFLRLLTSFEAVLPLKERSNLIEESLAIKILVSLR